MVSKSENVFLFCVLKSKHRKMFGNSAAFQRVLEELQFLERQGISIEVNVRKIQLHFVCLVIISDNAGNNQGVVT